MVRHLRFYRLLLLVLTSLHFGCGASEETTQEAIGQKDSTSPQNHTASGLDNVIIDPFSGEVITLEHDATQIRMVFLQARADVPSPLLTPTQADYYIDAIRAYTARMTFGRANAVIEELPVANLSSLINNCNVSMDTLNDWILQHYPQIANAAVSLILGRWNCGTSGAGGRDPHHFTMFANNIMDLETEGVDPDGLAGFTYFFRGLFGTLGNAPLLCDREGATFHNNYTHTGSYGEYGHGPNGWTTDGSQWSLMGYATTQITSITTAYVGPWNLMNTGWPGIFRDGEVVNYNSGNLQVKLGRYNTRTTTGNSKRLLNITRLVDPPPLPWFTPYWDVLVTLRRATSDGRLYLILELGPNAVSGAASMQIGMYRLTPGALPLTVEFTADTFTHHLSLTVTEVDEFDETAQILLAPLP